MPLLDHFRSAWSHRRHWHSFHSGWANNLVADLSEKLPEGFFAEPNAQFGIEIDVAAFDDRLERPAAQTVGAWHPPAPTLTIPFATETDVVEVLIFDSTAGPVLAGAIELVSPANKDRPAHREAFVSKCATYLQSGAGLIVVDIVTDRHANLHRALLDHFGAGDDASTDAPLYASAYRPVPGEGGPFLEIWPNPLTLGEPLPLVTLGLKGGLCLPLDLEVSYEMTRRQQRLTGGP